MSVLQRVSVENGTSYMFDRILSIPRILRMLELELGFLILQGYAGFYMNCILKTHRYFECLEF